MSFKTKKLAEKRAELVAKRLIKKLSGNCKTRVSENTISGWHFNVYLGTISVTEHPKHIKGGVSKKILEYSVLISSTIGEVGSGLAVWTDPNEKGYTKPEEAVRNAVKCMLAYTNNLQKVVDYNISKFPVKIL